jgi:PAS domain S-box-containing protein
MPFRPKVAQIGMILVLIPVIFELLFVSALATLLYSQSQDYFQVQRSKNSLLKTQRFYGLTMEAVQVIEASPATMSNREKADRLEKILNVMSGSELGWGLVDESNPELIELTKDATALREDMFGGFKRAIQAYRATPRGVLELGQFFDQHEIFTFILGTRNVNKRFLRIENSLAKAAPARSDLNKFILIGMGVNIFGLVVLIAFFTANLVNRLRSIYVKAQLIAAGQPLPEPDSRDDEIGELDRVITTAGQTLADARRRESAIFDGTAHVMCSLDAKLRVQTVGEACQRQWHLAPDELLGRSLLSLLPASDVDQVRTSFESIARTSCEGKVETRMRCGDGSVRTMLWNVHWRNGTFFCVVQDITELRSVEQLRQHFFSMASHDLRSPLTAVGMNISLITNGAKGPVAPDVVNELTKIDTNLSQLMSLVNEILALEKLEATRSDLTRAAVNAADVCESAKETLRDLAQECKVKITGPRGSALLHANEEKIEQAVTNLLSGVLKFSRPHSAVSILVEKRGLTGYIRVTQDGYTIPPHEANLIFDKFQQTHIEADRPVKRAGFGFAIVKTIAELHGGTVGVEPRAEGGSTVWMGIPLHPEDSD